MTPWSFILVAAGRGSRFGGKGKQLEMLEGCPVWEWSVRTVSTLEGHGLSEIVVVVPEGLAEEFKQPDLSPGIKFRFVYGGRTRRDSVLSGLRAAGNEWSLIHDAARPFASAGLCLRLMGSAIANGAAIPLIPVSDALKMVQNDMTIVGLDRSTFFLAQTPQAFPTEALVEVLLAAEEDVADEAEAWGNSGRKFAHVLGESMNFKITFPEDLHKARLIASGASESRTGLGYDVHPLRPGRVLVLGGVRIPFPLGLYGYSDGDLLCHAVSDALLGAAGLPDIGTIFPSSDPEYMNALSLDLLENVVGRIHRSGFRVSSVDAVINAQIPKLAPWIGKIEMSLKKTLFRGKEGRLTVKVKSGENIGTVGCGEAMVCWAFATIVTATVSPVNLQVLQ